MSTSEAPKERRMPGLRHAAAIGFLAASMTLFAGKAGAERPPVSDPGEEITPEELSTIPEPVPGNPTAGGRVRVRSPLPRAQEGSQRDSLPAEAPIRGQGPLWRVQVFATQDRDLADRMAREVGGLLRVRAHVAYEAPHYKVRLGDYASEDDARPLRERAVRSGYPGAFRIRCARDTTKSAD